MAAMPYPLVSTDWLAAHLADATVKVVDASWRMPGNPPPRLDFRERRIPGAVFFDIDEIADKTEGLPHMLPATDAFAAAAGALGLAASDRVVVYDDAGVFSAARVWWTFRAFGHEAVSVLDGGLPKWIREGRAVETGETAPVRNRYVVQHTRNLARDHEDVRNALERRTALILDARPAPRFLAEAPEPRPGLRRGHMPGAANVPHTALLTPDGTMKPEGDLRAILGAAGWTPGRPVIATCGSGVTAAVAALALEAVGAEGVGLYDGSWAEWGRETNDPAHFPVAGAAP